MSQRKDLTIDEAIRDPMIRLVMKADRVNPRAFEAMLRTVADEQGAAEIPFVTIGLARGELGERGHGGGRRFEI